MAQSQMRLSAPTNQQCSVANQSSWLIVAIIHVVSYISLLLVLHCCFF